MNIINKEYTFSVNMNLQGRNNLSTSEHFQGFYPCEFLSFWVYAIVFFVIIPMVKNAFYSNKEDRFTSKEIISLMNNFYSASVIQRFC